MQKLCFAKKSSIKTSRQQLVFGIILQTVTSRSLCHPKYSEIFFVFELIHCFCNPHKYRIEIIIIVIITVTTTQYFIKCIVTENDCIIYIIMTGQLIQYIVVRADLMKTLSWPVGSVIAQACHACCAVTYLFYNDPHMQEYLKDLDNMHKVVLEASIAICIES